MTKNQILKQLHQIYDQKPHRFQHVLGVCETAKKLGEIHHADLEKLEIAALLHDITKYYSKEENEAIIKDNFEQSAQILSEFNEHILHAFSAYVVAKNVYHVEDKDILQAIMHHTIGKPAMNIYEKIIFISDYIEPNRTYDSCVKVRDIAFENLDFAVYTAIDDSIKHYEENGGSIPKTAYEARTYYSKLLEEQNEKN